MAVQGKTGNRQLSSAFSSASFYIYFASGQRHTICIRTSNNSHTLSSVCHPYRWMISYVRTTTTTHSHLSTNDEDGDDDQDDDVCTTHFVYTVGQSIFYLYTVHLLNHLEGYHFQQTSRFIFPFFCQREQVFRGTHTAHMLFNHISCYCSSRSQARKQSCCCS